MDKQLTVVIKKKTNIQVTFLLLVICWNEKMIGIRKSVKSNQPTPLKPSFHSSILLTSKLQFVPVLKMISYQLNFLSFVFWCFSSHVHFQYRNIVFLWIYEYNDLKIGAAFNNYLDLSDTKGVERWRNARLTYKVINPGTFYTVTIK